MTHAILRSAALVAVASSLACSVSAARAEISVSCDYTANKKTAFCVTNDDGDKTLIRCDKNKNGTWRCAVVPAEVRGGVTVGPGLNRAVLNAAARAKRPLQTK